MSARIVVSGYLVRYPLGGHIWHHLQYLVGLKRLGHRVTYVEEHGWPDSCYNPATDQMTADPSYGIAFLRRMLAPHGLDTAWCYLAQDDRAHGMERMQLRAACRDADLYLNLSNINVIPETELCRKRALVDTDPVFTQIGAHGLAADLLTYDALFTYGANVNLPGSSMPDAGLSWQPTRQPVVLDLWPVVPGPTDGPFTTVMNWAAYGEHVYEGRRYGQKDREFESYFSLPREAGAPMEVAVEPPQEVRARLREGGWTVRSPLEVARTPEMYQQYLRASRAEFSVAKHAYVVTRCGWFSDRSTAYIASGRPVLVQDTGFSDWLESGLGVVPFRSHQEALSGIEDISARYSEHCRGARAVAERFFDAGSVLPDLVEWALRDA